MPAPPARSRSASVPCGLNSTSSCPARYCAAKSLFSPTYEASTLRTCPVSSSTPSPLPSTPMLLDTMVRSRTPESRTASIRSTGMPQSPNPPTAISWPSASTSRSASIAPVPTLDPGPATVLTLAW